MAVDRDVHRFKRGKIVHSGLRGTMTRSDSGRDRQTKGSRERAGTERVRGCNTRVIFCCLYVFEWTFISPE